MIICLDHGHASSTAGKRSPDGTLREYEFNRMVTKYMKEILEPYMEVIYSVDPKITTDYSLIRRCKTANDASADLFVSIHANAAGNGEEWTSAKGWEVYVCGKGGKAEKLATQVMYSVTNAIPDIKNRGIKVANFTVLTSTKMPAILIESGFQDNKEECELMKTKEYQYKLALAYSKGILQYLGIEYKEPEDKEWQYVLEEGLLNGDKNDMVSKGELATILYKLHK